MKRVSMLTIIVKFSLKFCRKSFMRKGALILLTYLLTTMGTLRPSYALPTDVSDTFTLMKSGSIIATITITEADEGTNGFITGFNLDFPAPSAFLLPDGTLSGEWIAYEPGTTEVSDYAVFFPTTIPAFNLTVFSDGSNNDVPGAPDLGESVSLSIVLADPNSPNGYTINPVADTLVITSDIAASVPEPATMLLLGSGLLGLWGAIRKSKK